MASASTTPGVPIIPREHLTRVKEYAVAVGGYGQVFQCVMRPPAAPEVLVAVKMLMHLTGDAPKKVDLHFKFLTYNFVAEVRLQRARREIKLWMAARHENIVPMLGITKGFSEESFAMVSPWMEGGTLAQYLERHKGNIPCRKKLTLMKDIASGLAYLHSRQIVHGDLTTNNIMLDDNERALLIDFGLSNMLGDSSLSLPAARPGAVRFAAPELLGVEEATSQPTGGDPQVHNQSPMPDMHSDIYSLGCVMLNVLTEQKPWYYLHDSWAIMRAILARKPFPIPDHSHLSEMHKQFIRKCTSIRVEGRPSSQGAVVFLEELCIEDTTAPIQPSMPMASNRDDLDKLDTTIPHQAALASIQAPSTCVFGQYEGDNDNVSPITIPSALSYGSCLTSPQVDFSNAAYTITPSVTPRYPLQLSDDFLTTRSSLFGASPSRTRNASTAMEQPNPRVLDLAGEAPRNSGAVPSSVLKKSTQIVSTFMKLLKSDQKILDPIVVPEDALSDSKILAINMTIRNACIRGDLYTAETLLTREINATNDYRSYAGRSFVMVRKADSDHALQDALKSVSIQPSLTGYISKGVALCGKQQFWVAMKAFDFAFMFAEGDLKTIHFLLLIKAIALFNANRHKDAILRVQELAATCPNADTLACRIVEAYLHVQLGINASEGAHHNEAADHFTAAINTIGFSSKWAIDFRPYEDFVVLFGWDLKSLWPSANQKRCHALLKAGRLGEALDSYRYMMDMSDERTKASYLHWSTAFKQECSSLYAADGDTSLAASDYDRAILQYSAAINLNSASDTIFANRSRAKLEKMLWDEALLDVQKVIELNPSSYIGYQLKHAALHGAQRYDEAIEAFQTMFSKLSDTPDMQIRRLRQQYVSPSEAEGAIQKIFNAQMQNVPLRVLDTTTGLLCDREAQAKAFKTSAEYKELFSSMLKHADLRMERIEGVVAMYFRCVMLSHRWEGKEPLLHDIQDTVVYDLDPDGGVAKLQSFCALVRSAGCRWAWSDTCCIDKNNHIELQISLNSMFVWYRHSALTVVYLSDVPPSSKSGALSKSAWTRRGWTIQEFLAPKVVLFYQKDWTLYLDDRSSNHKEPNVIMQELEDATGIGPRALVTFRPGMTGARDKFRWASMRVTTLQEDIVYSLFGIFCVNIPIIYGERKQNALGRLMQEIVAQSGDITVLDWVGKSSEFNSCLPADITSYGPPNPLPSASEDEMYASVSTLRDIGVVNLASRLYTTLDSLSAPRFAQRRLHLHCIVFPVTSVTLRRHNQDQETCLAYEVKADGLHDLLITTEDNLIQLSRARRTRQTFLLVRPWNRYLLEPPEFTDDAQSMQDHWSVAPSHGEDGPVNSESSERALQLIVRLGQPFGALLLVRQHGGEYRRIASDHGIIAQVKDMASVDKMMDVRTLEIL